MASIDRAAHRQLQGSARQHRCSRDTCTDYNNLTMSSSVKKRILVVGAGAAGMSCAEQLSQHPDRFDVTLVESQGYCGGQAFSIPIDEERFGSKWMNQGVQGCVYGDCSSQGGPTRY
jgi:NADPH-dependent 2,4-dienoyl-CoA reductase/sulfur reductase-like enzyme